MSVSESQTRPIPIWKRVPLYLQIVIALILAIGLGVLLGAGQPSPVLLSFVCQCFTRWQEAPRG